MLPVLIAAGAALLLMGGRKKSSSSQASSSSSSNSGGKSSAKKATFSKSFRPAPSLGSGSGKPGDLCDPPPNSPKGTVAAIGSDGKTCMVFWKPDTYSIVVAHIQAELNKLPKADQDELCSFDNCEPDPFAMDPESFCEWVPNPDREAFVKMVVLQLFPQIPSQQLPPPPRDSLGRPQGSQFVEYVWGRVNQIFGQKFCGFNPVT